MQKNISVFITTSNSTEWLMKVIWGYNTQTYRNFELILLDNTKFNLDIERIESIKKEVFFSIKIQTNEENLTKSHLLNKAILNCNTDYILLSEGNCIPRHDFIEQHIKFRQEGRFLMGGTFQLNNEVSNKITKENIYLGQCFEVFWLKNNGMKAFYFNYKVATYGIKSSILNFLNYNKKSWDGISISAWKNDILKPNIFENEISDENFDLKLNKQFIKNGLKPKQIFYHSVCLKLF